MAAYNIDSAEQDPIMGKIARCAYNSHKDNLPGGKFYRFPDEERGDELRGHTNVCKIFGCNKISFSSLKTKLDKNEVNVHVLAFEVNVSNKDKERAHSRGPKGRVEDGCTPDVQFTYIDQESADAATRGVSSYASAISDEHDARSIAVSWNEQTGKEMAAELGKAVTNAKKALKNSRLDLVPAVKSALFSAEAKLLWNSGRVGEDYNVVISQQGAQLVVTFSGLSCVSFAVAKSMFSNGLVNDVVVDMDKQTVSVSFHFTAAAASSSSGSKRRRDEDGSEESDDDDLDGDRRKKKSKGLLSKIVDALLPAP